MEYLNTILIIIAFGVIIWLISKNKQPEEVKDDKAIREKGKEYSLFKPKVFLFWNDYKQQNLDIVWSK